MLQYIFKRTLKSSTYNLTHPIKLLDMEEAMPLKDLCQELLL